MADSNNSQKPKDEGSGVSFFFHKVAQSIFTAKHKVLESLGQVDAVIDPDTQKRIDKLNFITSQYDRLLAVATQLLNNFKAFSESQRLLGDHLYETGVKEEERLREPLREAGDIHRLLEKKSSELITSLKQFIDVTSTFRNAAIDDTLLNLERYTQARHAYHGALVHLQDLQEPTPEARLIVDESKKLMDKTREDLVTKIVVLNEKRVQDLTFRLAEYMKSLRSYYSHCNEVFDQYEWKVGENKSTEDFKNLMSDTKQGDL